MAQVFTGKDGRLLLDGLEQIKVTNWSLTGSLEMLETTSLGDNQRTYCPGVQEFNGSATLLMSATASKSPATRSALARAANSDMRRSEMTPSCYCCSHLKAVHRLPVDSSRLAPVQTDRRLPEAAGGLL